MARARASVDRLTRSRSVRWGCIWCCARRQASMRGMETWFVLDVRTATPARPLALLGSRRPERQRARATRGWAKSVDRSFISIFFSYKKICLWMAGPAARQAAASRARWIYGCLADGGHERAITFLGAAKNDTTTIQFWHVLCARRRVERRPCRAVPTHRRQALPFAIESNWRRAPAAPGCGMQPHGTGVLVLVLDQDLSAHTHAADHGGGLFAFNRRPSHPIPSHPIPSHPISSLTSNAASETAWLHAYVRPVPVSRWSPCSGRPDATSLSRAYGGACAERSAALPEL